MPYTEVAPRLLSWATDIEPDTIQQAARTARLPFVEDHIALMPDAHLGIGATVGSVIPTNGAIMPAAVGVDIGCGMIAAETTLRADDLPDNLDILMALIAERIPAGVGKGHQAYGSADSYTLPAGLAAGLTSKQAETAALQHGTLGSGNHFVEVCLDETQRVWAVLHSGSRGIGNQLAQMHITKAKGEMKRLSVHLEDPDLAYFVQGTPEFDDYIADMRWAQDYAMSSRAKMMKAALKSLEEAVTPFAVTQMINCHHNFTQLEIYDDRPLWITRKGAIQADAGRAGIIPGSMGTGTYIVRGKGVKASWNSCAHGAGRRMSRGAARRTFTAESLIAAMGGKTWNDDKATNLLDEHPESYKDIEGVMADQEDLVTVEHVLHQVFNYKGA